LIGRPPIDQTMLEIAYVLAQRATCAKLAVGCVLVDTRYRIVGTGYNGNARGQTHCLEKPCPGRNAPRGSDLCEAIHAEQNALLTCHVPDDIHVCYTTHAPCMRCTKLLLNTGCRNIVFANGDFTEPAAQRLWRSSDRCWFKYSGLADSPRLS